MCLKIWQKFIAINFIFYETNYDSYNYISILKLLLVIFKNQYFGGIIIIKIKDIFYKPIIDLFYILSSLYDKVYISKPNTNNIITLSFVKNFVNPSWISLNILFI